MRRTGICLLSALSTPAFALPEYEAGAPTFDELTVDLDLRPMGESVPLDLAQPGYQGVVNGTIVGTYEYENVVALGALSPWGGFVFCSGSLIDHEWVLTAAHCVEGMDYLENYGYDLVILFGADLLNDGFTDSIRWRRAYPHPQYNGAQFTNDIGLVELDEPKYGVDFVVLNDDPVTGAWIGKELTLLGFGITDDGLDNAGIKRVTEAPVYDYDSMYVYTYDPGTNVCQGDSGGPDFETTASGDLEQVGVNAFVAGGCDGGAAGLTRVDVYLNWIKGYAPNVLTSGSGAGSGGTEPEPDPEPEPTDPSPDPGTDPADPGSTNDLASPEPLSPDVLDLEMDEAPRPAKRAFPIGARCDTSGRAPLSGAFVLLAMWASRRRVARGARGSA